MTEPTIAQQLRHLRERLAQLEWAAAAPGADAIDQVAMARLVREIDRLEKCQRLGYEHEPDF